jgi:hypothetical protein
MMNVSNAELLPIPARIVPLFGSNRMALWTNPFPLPRLGNLPQLFSYQIDSDKFFAATLVPIYLLKISIMKIEETRK